MGSFHTQQEHKSFCQLGIKFNSFFTTMAQQEYFK